MIDERGYIITNHHVVEGVKKIQVTLAGGQSHTATLVSHDPRTDLAVIKINAKEPLACLTVGTSSDLMTGEPVIAVGNAYGYEHTATEGIISALHRTVQVSDAQQYRDLIQVSADQPRQFRRAAVEHRRRADRHQRGSPGRSARHRLCHSDRHRHVDRR